MRRFLSATFLFFAVACIASCAASDENASVFAYLPEWRYEGLNYEEAFKVVTHLIFFSVEVSPQGKLQAKDRLPRTELLESAQRWARESGGQLLLCVGGNGRSDGFPHMVKQKDRRAAFIQELLDITSELGLHGVDLNWEYPGFQFGRGYIESQVEADYRGYGMLLKEMHSAFKEHGKLITLAYYPDGRQERLLTGIDAHLYADYLHSMAYDQSGKHSTLELAEKTVANAVALFPASAHRKVTLGLPFYARSVTTGDWKSYEDIVAMFPSQWNDDQAGQFYWNGPATIATKTALALRHGLGGVMIWEGGQDCRVTAVHRLDGTVHQSTCPLGTQQSLLTAIASAVPRTARTDFIRSNDLL